MPKPLVLIATVPPTRTVNATHMSPSQKARIVEALKAKGLAVVEVIEERKVSKEIAHAR
jgi:hypothetical protein